jgi:DNA-binding LacI/PurR family transcriptional regulator
VVDAAQQRGLARPGRADDHDGLAALHLERDVAKHRQRPEGLAHARHAQEGRVAHRAPRAAPITLTVPHERLEGSAYASTAELLTRPDRPDAIYAVSEPYATGALRAAREHGLRVPDDLLLVAGVDSHEASTGDPPITALDLHPDEQAAIAVELLAARVDDREAEVPRTVPGTLSVRRSSLR